MRETPLRGPTSPTTTGLGAKLHSEAIVPILTTGKSYMLSAGFSSTFPHMLSLRQYV